MKFLPHTLLLLCLGLFTFNSNAQESLRKKHFNIENGLAVQGYDVVAYFVANKAIKGDSKFATTHQGVKYHFSSQNNKDLFLANPMKYEPQFGGWCAFAMGDSGEKVEIDPSTFKIVDGKLYLFFNAWYNNTLPSWNKDEKNLKAKAVVNWNKIYK